MMKFKGEAKLEYYPNDYHILSSGAYVICASTGQQIPLDELKYWSVELQEAYSSPEASFKRYIETHKKNVSE